MNEGTQQFEGWAVVEVMGHQTYAGYVTETQIAGAGMLRMDVPEVIDDEHGGAVPAYTRYIAPSSLYGITPVDEESARIAARALRKRPVTIYGMANLLRQPSAIPARTEPDAYEDVEFRDADLDDDDADLGEGPGGYVEGDTADQFFYEREQ